MELNEFTRMTLGGLKQLALDLSDLQIQQLYLFMNMVLEKNKVMNLTSITDPEEFVIKHIIDSLTVAKYASKSRCLIDVGTGAGFPGVPLKILFPDTEVSFMDSVLKKVDFIRECTNALGLEKTAFLHKRAEDVGSDPAYRGRFDCSVARAVAKLPVLLEYCLPLLKKGGIFIAMKSGNIEEELASCKNALSVLQASVTEQVNLILPGTDINRSIIVFQVNDSIPTKYPRKAGMPVKKPL